MNRTLICWLLVASAACGGDDTVANVPDGSTNPDGMAGVDGKSDANPDPDGGGPPSTCTPAIKLVDVSGGSNVVGTGGAASCTEAALDTALKKGGIVTFNCGGPATIVITSEKVLRTDVDTTIDGATKVTLDGQGKTRLLSFRDPDYRKSKVVVTLQNLTLVGGKSTGTAIPPAPLPCSQGTDVDGGGAAVFVRNGMLHVNKVTFKNNTAAPLGPDVAGGGVFALGSLGVVIQDSVFDGNSGSNGGAIGSLNSDLTIVGSTFTNNQALGDGANSVDTSKCATTSGEVGNGGNGAAVVIDGGDGAQVVVCGSVFKGNKGGAFGGAMFRTPDNQVQTTQIETSTFDSNIAKNGGALYFHHSLLEIVSSLFSNNSASGAGAIQADDTKFDFTNVTFYGNSATTGLGGAILLFAVDGGTIVNSTFARNKAEAGSGLFAAAIGGGASFSMQNDLFSDNTSKDCGAPMACQVKQGGGGNNLQWPDKHTVCTNPDPACGSGTMFADPKLGPLADNGGPTWTALPQAGSPAIGAGKICPSLDQRGHARKTPDGCTIGAVEAP